jgi:hypothetical protein
LHAVSDVEFTLSVEKVAGIFDFLAVIDAMFVLVTVVILSQSAAWIETILHGVM